MGENDIQSIREDLGEVKQSLSGISKAVTDLRVLVAGNYVTKEDFQKCQDCAEARVVKLHQRIDDHEKEERANRWKMAGLVATVTGLALSVIQWVVGLYKGGGNS